MTTCIYYENQNITNPLIILYFSPVPFPLSFFSISFPALAKFHNRSSVIYPSVYPLQKFKSSPQQDTKSIWSLSTSVSSAKKSNSSHSCSNSVVWNSKVWSLYLPLITNSKNFKLSHGMWPNWGLHRQSSLHDLENPV